MDSAKTFQEFKEILKSYEIKTFSKFNVYQNPKGFLDEKREISEGMKLHWNDGLPYFHFGKRIYTCHQGKDKNLGKKKKYAEKKQEMAKSNIFQKTYNLKKPTKKLDCPASITITRVYALPQFKLENPTKSKKFAASARIRHKLKNNEDIKGEELFWFALPSVDAHNHMQIPATTEPVDVDHGCDDPDVIPQENYEKTQGAVPQENHEKTQGVVPQENHEKTQGAVPQENHEKTQGAVVCGELVKRERKRRKLINECNSHMRNLGSVLCMLPESALLELNKDLLGLAEKMQNRVTQDNSTGLPLEINEYRKSCSGMPVDKVKEVETSKASKGATEDSIKKQYGKLQACSKRGSKKRVGMGANAVIQAYKQIMIERETEYATALIDGYFEMGTM